KAVEPLIRVILDPSKGDVASTALLALVKIGKPSVDRAVKMLNESDPLVAYAKKAIKEATDADKEPEGNPALSTAAAIIGMAGRSDGTDPLINLLETKLSDEDKALVARELPKLPATTKTKEAFKKAFESISIDATVHGTPALAILAESAATFYDSTMIDWMLDRAQKTSGGGEAKTALQQSLVSSAIKVAKADQWATVEAAAKKYELADIAATAAAVVKACGDKVDCYLAEVEKTDNQNEKNQLAGIKAAYMVGELGDAKARDALVERLSSLENDAVQFAALNAIDNLCPTYATVVFMAHEELIEKNEMSADSDKLSNNAPLKQIAYRISVR